MSDKEKADLANHANVRNPEHSAFYRSRGFSPEAAGQMAKEKRAENQRAIGQK